MKPELTKYIVFTYFSGDATTLQKKMIEEWLGEREHVEMYFEWLEEWETLQPQFLPDTSAALDGISERLLLTESGDEVVETTPLPIRQRKLQQVWKWVAAAILVLGIGSYAGRNVLMYRTYETAFGELKTFSLDDSSSVVLNANSSLRVPRWGFGKTTRNVFLRGEAEFSVKHTFDHQYFTVHTADQSKITVLGTEFVVYTREHGTNVVLNKGKVQLSSNAEAEPTTMEPGDRATVEKDGAIKIEQLSQLQLSERSAWKEHRFVFDDTPLREVALKIREVFGVIVQISDEHLAMRTATGSFPAKNAEELLTNMSLMYSFEITKSDKKIILIPNP